MSICKPLKLISDGKIQNQTEGVDGGMELLEEYRRPSVFDDDTISDSSDEEEDIEAVTSTDNNEGNVEKSD